MLQIVSIERVQNAAMLDAYQNQRDYLERKYAVGLQNGAVRVNARSAGDGQPIERELWHGTKTLDPKQVRLRSNGARFQRCDLLPRRGDEPVLSASVSDIFNLCSHACCQECK